MLEFSINGKQAIALIWTVIAFAIALIVVLSPVGSFFLIGYSWQMSVALFFALFLIMTFPIYLLIALWQIVSKSDSS